LAPPTTPGDPWKGHGRGVRTSFRAARFLTIGVRARGDFATDLKEVEICTEIRTSAGVPTPYLFPTCTLAGTEGPPAILSILLPGGALQRFLW
jgi:hypothetical protein